MLKQNTPKRRGGYRGAANETFTWRGLARTTLFVLLALGALPWLRSTLASSKLGSNWGAKAGRWSNGNANVRQQSVTKLVPSGQPIRAEASGLPSRLNSVAALPALFGPPTIISEIEANNTAATANMINLATQPCAIISGAINPGGDQDFFSFTASAGSRVWIITDTGGPQAPTANSRNTVIDLIASNGVTVIENDDDDGIGNGGDGSIETDLASIIGGPTLAAGIHYIRVRGFSNTETVNPYKLFIVVTNVAATPEVEGNNTTATANTIVTGSSFTGLRSASISAAGDSDYYSVVASAGDIVYFNADADPERDGVGTNLLVEFRDPSDMLLLAVDSSITGSGSNPAAEGANYTITIPGTYYVRVRHFDTLGTGTYDLMVSSCNDGCSLALSQTAQSFTPTGGMGSFTVTTGCAWQAVSNNPDFITITAPAGGSGSGNGTISFTVASHNATTPRSGTISVGGQTFTVYQGAQFLDVPPTHPFYTEISKLSARGITSGCGGGNYCPNGDITRQQMAVFLLRSREGGSYAPPPATGTVFADVPVGLQFADFIEKLFADGITSGCATSPLRYCPTSSVTRDQMAVFVLRAKEGGSYMPPAATGTVFADVPLSHPFAAFIEELQRRGITSGCGGGNYCPTSSITRGQMAVFLVRTFGL